MWEQRGLRYGPHCWCKDPIDDSSEAVNRSQVIVPGIKIQPGDGALMAFEHLRDGVVDCCNQLDAIAVACGRQQGSLLVERK